MSTNEFVTAFRHLSHHLFPDGCPDASLNDFWPGVEQTSLFVLAVTSSQQAIQSMNDLYAFAKENRLSKQQLSAVSVALVRMTSATDLSSVLVNNKDHFRALMRCMLPRDNYSITYKVVARLLSIERENERCTVFRFLTLALQGGGWLDAEACQALTGPHFYASIFQSTFIPTMNTDAVRLVIHLTTSKHATKCRIRRVQLAIERDKINLKALHSLLAHLRQVCDITNFAGRKIKGDNALLSFPEELWEDDFSNGTIIQRPTKRRCAIHPCIITSKSFSYSGSVADCLTNHDLHQLLIVSLKERARFQSFLSEGLYITWADSPTEESRIHLLNSLSLFVSNVKWMPVAISQLVLDTVLPNWDGTERPLGLLICRSLIPNFSWSSSFVDVERLVGLLTPHFLYGISSQKRLVLSSLSRLFEEILLTQRSTKHLCHGSIPSLFSSVSGLILKGVLNSSNVTESICLALVHLYEIVGLVCRRFHFAGLPSSLVVNHLLLSACALPIDRICDVLASSQDRMTQFSRDGGINSPSSAKGFIRLLSNCRAFLLNTNVFNVEDKGEPSFFTGFSRETWAQLREDTDKPVCFGCAFVSHFLAFQTAVHPYFESVTPDNFELDLTRYVDMLTTHNLTGMRSLLIQ